jgi:CheY-like chemotaxis protein
MPEMDGLTAIREIRKQPAFKRLPVIALTAKAMNDDREQALAAGANDYMAKPFEVDKLVSLCRVWLRRS